jgi:hypothetical protein
MSLEDFIITVFCLVDDMLTEVVNPHFSPLRAKCPNTRDFRCILAFTVLELALLDLRAAKANLQRNSLRLRPLLRRW